MAQPYGLAKRQTIYQSTENHCAYCGADGIDTFLILDHVTPKVLGGRSTIDNLIPACHSCNSSKGGRTLEQYRHAQLKKQGKVFSQEQLTYLASLGITLPEPPPHRFWFEQR